MSGPWMKYRQGGTQAVPSDPLKVQGAQAGVANTQASTARTRQQTQADAQLLPYQVQKARADAAKAQAEAQQSSGLDRQKLANIRAAQAQIDRINQLYKQGPGRTSGFSGVLDYLPTPTNSKFNTAGAGLGEMALAAFRVPGVGSQSDAELKAFIEANRPSASDYDAQIQEKINNLQNRLNQTYQAYGMKRPPAKNDGWKIERIGD